MRTAESKLTSTRRNLTDAQQLSCSRNSFKMIKVCQRLLIITWLTFVTFTAGQIDPCQGSPPLSDRLLTYIRSFNPNNDSVVNGSELREVLLQQVDANRDACITNTEWLDHWSSKGFSTAYASALLTTLKGDADRNCSLDLQQAGQYEIPASHFVNDCVNTLISLCENDTTLYETRCDCHQLGEMCGRDAYFINVIACRLYTAGVFFGK